MSKPRILTTRLVIQCQREYEAGNGSMNVIAARHGIAVSSLRKERRRLGLPKLGHGGGPKPGTNCGGGMRKFVPPEVEVIQRWDDRITPGWRVHGEVRG